MTNRINIKLLRKIKIITLILVIISLVVITPVPFFTAATPAYAATTPNLGTAGTFGVLSTTFTRNIGITAITGDLGYTTLGGSGSHTASGTTFTPSPAQAGIDQGAALSTLNAQGCDFNFGSPTDLSSLTQPLTPGVYCIAAATSIGAGGITLSGSGTYIFRITGALTSASGAVVTLSGPSACDVFWTPTFATTLGANNTFAGTVIDDVGITVGSTTSWTGRALAFNGTVTTDTDTITVPICTIPTSTPTPTSAPTSGPTSTPTSTSLSSSSPSYSTAICIGTLITTVPTIIDSRRSDADSIFISWGPFAGIDTFTIRYGLTNGNWLYSTNVTGFSTTINDLPPNQPIWVQVAASNGCTVGSYGESMLVGGPSLPNAGLDPMSIILLGTSRPI